MDINAIYQKAQPYIQWFLGVVASAGGVSGLVAIVMSIVKTRANAKNLDSALKEIKNSSLSMVQQAFPTEIKVSLQNFAKSEIKAVLDYAMKDMSTQLLDMQETLNLLAQAILCLKSVPDELKAKIKDQTKVEDKNEVLVVAVDDSFKEVVIEKQKTEVIPEV